MAANEMLDFLQGLTGGAAPARPAMPRFSPEEERLMAAEGQRQAQIRTARPPELPQRAQTQAPGPSLPWWMTIDPQAESGEGWRRILFPNADPAQIRADLRQRRLDAAAAAAPQARAAGVAQPAATAVAASGSAAQAPQAASAQAKPALQRPQLSPELQRVVNQVNVLAQLQSMPAAQRQRLAAATPAPAAPPGIQDQIRQTLWDRTMQEVLPVLAPDSGATQEQADSATRMLLERAALLLGRPTLDASLMTVGD